MRLLRALVDKHETDDRAVGSHRSHACVHPHVIVFRQVVVTQLRRVARRGLHNARLTQPRIEPAVVQRTVPVVLLDKQLSRIRAVNPLGNFINRKVLAPARYGIAQDNSFDGGAAKQANRTGLNRANPPRMTVFVNLERLLVEHVERVLQLHVAVNVARQRFGG